MQLHSTRAIPLDDCRYSACFNHDLGLGFYGGMVGKKNVISTMLQSHGYDHCNDTMGRN
jgi:hypothetical protein